MQATLVLLNWKRPQNIQRIIDCRPDWCDDVVVWNNSSEPLDVSDARVIDSPCGNIFTLGRFIAADFARYDTIISQDDDCIVMNWDELLMRFDACRRVTTNLNSSHYKLINREYRVRDQSGDVIGRESLLGWGSIWDRSMQRPLVELSRAAREHFHLVERKADRLFCLLQSAGVAYLPVNPHHLKDATKPEALYRRKDHWRLTTEARELFVRYKAGAL
jgi:hypothetical protein